MEALSFINEKSKEINSGIKSDIKLSYYMLNKNKKYCFKKIKVMKMSEFQVFLKKRREQISTNPIVKISFD